MKTKGYTGNKSPTGLFPKIINTFPPHKVYIEGFAGSYQIGRKKKPAKLNIAVELSSTLAGADKNNYPSGVVVVNDCMISLLDDFKHCSKDTLIYLDPPYIINDRLGKKALYEYELTDDQHRQLLNKLKECRSHVAISHYRSCLYDEILHDWYRIDMQVSYHGKIVTECLYMNYPPAVKLHETTYTGKNKTDRQRIKRKADRWVKMLKKMPPHERQHVLETIIEQLG
ncbi:MAG: methylase [Bacteroidota bacterium]|jgi:hypothetical protein|nr:methylase [Bacteroidota bacterium]